MQPGTTRIVFAPKLEVKPHPGHLPHPLKGWVQECAGGFHYADARHHHRSSEGDRLTVHCLDTQFMARALTTRRFPGRLKNAKTKEERGMNLADAYHAFYMAVLVCV